MDAAIDSQDSAIRRYAISNIFDLKVLSQMTKSDDSELVKLAKEQIRKIEEVKNGLYEE